MSGRVFVIQYKNYSAAVSTLHQFDGGAPRNTGLRDGQNLFLDTKKVFKQEDLQVQIVTQAKKKYQVLPYDPDFYLMLEEQVIMIPGLGMEPVTGSLERQGFTDSRYHSSEGPRVFTMHLDRWIDARGCSGSPIISLKTGKVVGVMQTASVFEPHEAYEVGFETLCLPGAGEPKDPEPANPGNFFGVPYEGQVSKELEAAFYDSVIHPVLAQMEYGMTKGEFEAVMAKGTISEAMFEARYLFNHCWGSISEDKSVDLPFDCIHTPATKERILTAVRFFCAAYGAPDLAFTRDLSSEKDMIASVWEAGDINFGISIHYSTDDLYPKFKIADKGTTKLEELIYTKDMNPIEGGSPGVISAFESWCAQNVTPERMGRFEP